MNRVSAPLLMVFATGFLTCSALIVTIGAQNAFVLRQGIRREHIGAVIAVCTISDVILISAGIAGFGALVTAHPDIVTVAKLGGAAFLIGYGLLAAKRALHPAALTPAEDTPARLTSVLGTCLALTFLNPHVWLDTVVLLGALAHEHRDARWLFGVGAVTASAVWFTSLGFGATQLSRLFAKPATWRVLDGVIAATMLSLGAYLALS